MANPAADPKSAPLADDLKELALSLPTTALPKNFFCALCSQLAIDSYKLLCCNKAICTPCQTKLQFPTTCPSCDHSPLEADSCTPNKALRNTQRVWLQKRKKKEDEKAAAQAATPPLDATPAAPEVQPGSEAADKPVETVEEALKAEDFAAEEATGAAENSEDAGQRVGSTATQSNEKNASPEIKMERRGSTASQTVTKSMEPSGTNDPSEVQNSVNGSSGTVMNNSMMNGMQGQMGFGFPNQGGFNNGVGWNGMPNMMANGNWNDFNQMNNMPNGMYGNFGGNMGMGMNDMSSMMQYGGGYGNGWNGMGGGYGNFNGPNQMGGYNQSGAYPDMMNQFPKNNFPNQNQNRFHANQGGVHPQRDRNGSRGSFGSVFQKAQSRPGSGSGPAQNRDGQSPVGTAGAAPQIKPDGEQPQASAEITEEGKESDHDAESSANPRVAQNNVSGESKVAGDVTDQAENGSNESTHDSGLNPIQTVDSGDADMPNYDQSMMGHGIQSMMPYQQGMMGQFPNQQMNPAFDPSMNMNMGYNQQNNFGPRGGFNNGAYGAARVLTGQPAEPIGVGVVGAPTGPRAMREGRPNTGFSSRQSNSWVRPAPKSVTSTQGAGPGSPQRRVRSRSPLRDETLRVQQRSPTRSRSRSRQREEVKEEVRERSQSADRESRRDDRGRSSTPKSDEKLERPKERRHYRSSRHDEREEDLDERRRDDRDSRGDRTRSASVESKYRSSRRDKEKHRSSRSHRDRSKDHRRRHRSRSLRGEDKYEDDDTRLNVEKDSDASSRRKHRSGDKEKYRERERDRSRDKDRERDRQDRKDRDRDYEHEREKDRSRDKDKDRRRRRDREVEDDDRDHDDDKHRSSRRSRKDRNRESDKERDYDDHEPREKLSRHDKEEDVVGQMMKKRPVSPPLNAPTGPSANGFSIKGRSKAPVMPPPQPPTGPRGFQPPKGPAADRNKDRSDLRDHKRKSSVSSLPSGQATPTTTAQDHYAAERERHARERDGRERAEKPSSKSLYSRISSRPSLSSKRSRDDDDDRSRSASVQPATVPKGPKADIKAPTGPSSHRDKRRKSGATGDDNIANLFTAGLRKNAKRRGGVRTEGDVEREMEIREREGR